MKPDHPLPEDEAVRRAYADSRGAAEAPPPVLDDAIRAAARRAVHARPQARLQTTEKNFLTRHRVPLSAAAVVLLSSSLLMVSIRERADLGVDAPRATPAATQVPMAKQPAQDPLAELAVAPVAAPASPAPAPDRAAAVAPLGKKTDATPSEQLALAEKQKLRMPAPVVSTATSSAASDAPAKTVAAENVAQRSVVLADAAPLARQKENVQKENTQKEDIRKEKLSGNLATAPSEVGARVVTAPAPPPTIAKPVAMIPPPAAPSPTPSPTPSSPPASSSASPPPVAVAAVPLPRAQVVAGRAGAAPARADAQAKVVAPQTVMGAASSAATGALGTTEPRGTSQAAAAVAKSEAARAEARASEPLLQQSAGIGSYPGKTPPFVREPPFTIEPDMRELSEEARLKENRELKDKDAKDVVEQLSALHRTKKFATLQRELTLFRKRYPDYPLPKELQELETQMKEEARKPKPGTFGDNNPPG